MSHAENAFWLGVARDVALILAMCALAWRLWVVSRRQADACGAAEGPPWAQALEARLAHLQTAVFKIGRKQDRDRQTAATEPAMRQGLLPGQTPGASPSPPPMGGTGRLARGAMAAFHDTERLEAAEIEAAVRHAAEADSGPLPPVDREAPTPRQTPPPAAGPTRRLR